MEKYKNGMKLKVKTQVLKKNNITKNHMIRTVKIKIEIKIKTEKIDQINKEKNNMSKKLKIIKINNNDEFDDIIIYSL